MKIRLKEKNKVCLEDIKLGDFIVNAHGDLRQIVKINDRYTMLGIEDGLGINFMFSSLSTLLDHYNRNFIIVRVIKSEDMTLVERGA